MDKISENIEDSSQNNSNNFVILIEKLFKLFEAHLNIDFLIQLIKEC